MYFDEQLDIEHLLFCERKCRVCRQVKDLVDGFYLTRKGKGTLPSAYSYECKECTKDRIIERRKNKKLLFADDYYPNW